MTVSVCMGVYNGERYIEEQLKSILSQTRQADEVILCDDNSTDKTVEIIRNFIKHYDLQNKWKLYKNEVNKGYPGNFYYAMKLAAGDIVFLADQDDVWHEKKLELMCQAFEEDRDAVALSCKFGLINGEGKNIHTLMSPTHSTGTGKLRDVTLREVFYKCQWPGMVLAYRNEWYKRRVEPLTLVKEGGFLQIPHDFLICATAAEEDGFRQMDSELAFHRRHDQNTGKEEHHISKLLDKQRKQEEIEDYLEILKNFDTAGILKTPEGREAHRQKTVSMQGRLKALQSGKISAVLHNAWENRKEVRIATIVCDLLIVKQGRTNEETHYN